MRWAGVECEIVFHFLRLQGAAKCPPGLGVRPEVSSARRRVLARSACFTCWFYFARNTHFRIFSDASTRHMSNSVEVAPLLSPREGRLSSSLPRWQGVALLLLVAWIYASILARLFLQWVGPSRDPNFEHGIFVPLFALFVLWENRKKLTAIASVHPGLV